MVPIPLPIDEVLPQLIEALRREGIALLRAPTGAGKTTRVPPALLDAGLAAGPPGEGEVVVLQPRRVAARACARRIAHERGQSIGEEVGYQVRFDKRCGPRTRIRVVTEGVFLRRLVSDPFLEGIGAVIFDEFHERRLDSDLALAMTRSARREVREDLRVVVMSATLELDRLRGFLGNPPVIESLGREFPVERRYLAPEQRAPRGIPDEHCVAGAVRRALEATRRDLLVFLPGIGEIRRARRALEATARAGGIELRELYGDLPAAEQDRLFEETGPRRIILATNVAETSITLPRIGAVIDSGLHRRPLFDPTLSLDRLTLAPISRASAEQRAGRAGRTAPGICYRLWTEGEDRARPAWIEPEIERIDLSRPFLELLAWGEADPESFEWFEAPPTASLARSKEVLQLLGAIEARASGGWALTEVGRRIARLPLPPRLARLLLEGDRLGVAEDAATCAALLAERSPFQREPRGAPQRTSAVDSDLLDAVHALDDFECRGLTSGPAGELRRGAARAVLRVRDQLLALLPGGPRAARSKERFADLSRALLAAFPDRLARRRRRGGDTGVMLGGRGVALAPECGVRGAELFLCLEVDAGGRDSLVRRASGVEREWLPEASTETSTEVEFDEKRERLTAVARTRYADLVLDEAPTALSRDEVSARALAGAAAGRLERALDLEHSSFASFRARAACLREWCPELELPAVDDEALGRLLPELCRGRLSFDELRKAPLLDTLRARFDWQQLQVLDREAPERIEVPSGSRIALHYELGRPPVLAVRIQEVFGWTETPRIAAGRVGVLLHLLAPNGRPQQVTEDLQSFWATTYAQVRKELRRRYPKHAWPEDPLTAEPIRGVRRRGS